MKNHKFIHFFSESNNNKLICPICMYVARSEEDTISITENNSCGDCNLNYYFELNKPEEERKLPTVEEARQNITSNIYPKEINK
jgi:hypothetical protein